MLTTPASASLALSSFRHLSSVFHRKGNFPSWHFVLPSVVRSFPSFVTSFRGHKSLLERRIARDTMTELEERRRKAFFYHSTMPCGEACVGWRSERETRDAISAFAKCTRKEQHIELCIGLQRSSQNSGRVDKRSLEPCLLVINMEGKVQLLCLLLILLPLTNTFK